MIMTDLFSGYRVPCEKHPTSILTISNAEGSGRAAGTGAKPIKPVIGSVILHDKLKFWTSGSRSTHYHQGMSAGDSTLTALCCLQILQVEFCGNWSDALLFQIDELMQLDNTVLLFT